MLLDFYIAASKCLWQVQCFLNYSQLQYIHAYLFLFLFLLANEWSYPKKYGAKSGYQYRRRALARFRKLNLLW